MSVVIPDCTSCKHIFKENDSTTFYCSAFPNGIPKDYFWGNVDVRKIFECANGIKFEED
ncbi:MAG: glutamyl-tRNA amidotransferase [Ruminococcus sp.]|nr:glutamyl-tRNA amidotransferase [Ruminococcus sp.]